MIPRDWSPGVKFFGLYWPTRAWWLQGPFWYNHPLSHLIGGIALAIPLLLAGFTAVQTIVLAGVVGVIREESQIEYWSDRGGYPLYSAAGDAAFVVLGALGVIMAARLLG